MGTLQDYRLPRPTRPSSQQLDKFVSTPNDSFVPADFYSTSSSGISLLAPRSRTKDGRSQFQSPVGLAIDFILFHSDRGMCSLDSTTTVFDLRQPLRQYSPVISTITAHQSSIVSRYAIRNSLASSRRIFSHRLSVLCRTLVIVQALERQTFQCLCSAT